MVGLGHGRGLGPWSFGPWSVRAIDMEHGRGYGRGYILGLSRGS